MVHALVGSRTLVFATAAVAEPIIASAAPAKIAIRIVVSPSRSDITASPLAAARECVYMGRHESLRARQSGTHGNRDRPHIRRRPAEAGRERHSALAGKHPNAAYARNRAQHSAAVG